MWTASASVGSWWVRATLPSLLVHFGGLRVSGFLLPLHPFLLHFLRDLSLVLICPCHVPAWPHWGLASQGGTCGLLMASGMVHLDFPCSPQGGLPGLLQDPWGGGTPGLPRSPGVACLGFLWPPGWPAWAFPGPLGGWHACLCCLVPVAFVPTPEGTRYSAVTFLTLHIISLEKNVPPFLHPLVTLFFKICYGVIYMVTSSLNPWIPGADPGAPPQVLETLSMPRRCLLCGPGQLVSPPQAADFSFIK